MSFRDGGWLCDVGGCEAEGEESCRRCHSDVCGAHLTEGELCPDCRDTLAEQTEMAWRQRNEEGE